MIATHYIAAVAFLSTTTLAHFYHKCEGWGLTDPKPAHTHRQDAVFYPVQAVQYWNRDAEYGKSQGMSLVRGNDNTFQALFYEHAPAIHQVEESLDYIYFQRRPLGDTTTELHSGCSVCQISDPEASDAAAEAQYPRAPDC